MEAEEAGQIAELKSVLAKPAAEWTGWPGGALSEPKPIFPRLELDRQEALIAKGTRQDKPAGAGALVFVAPLALLGARLRRRRR